MRKLVIILALLVLATAAQAQKAGTVDVSAFLSDPSASWTSSAGTNVRAGYGLSANVFFSPRWSGVLSVERNSRVFLVGTAVWTFRVFPVDALVRYQFTNDSRWKPYLGVGFNYFNRPLGLPHRMALEANGGVTFAITPRLGINADFKQQQIGRSLNDGPQSRAALGLTWRF